MEQVGELLVSVPVENELPSGRMESDLQYARIGASQPCVGVRVLITLECGHLILPASCDDSALCYSTRIASVGGDGEFCGLTLRFAARRTHPLIRRYGCRRVRQHPHVRRQHLRRWSLSHRHGATVTRKKV